MLQPISFRVRLLLVAWAVLALFMLQLHEGRFRHGDGRLAQLNAWWKQAMTPGAAQR